MDGQEKPSLGEGYFPSCVVCLIALPIVAVFGLLLSSADPVFGDWMKKIFDLEKLPEYLFRLFYILLIGGVPGRNLPASHSSGKGVGQACSE